MSRGGRGGAKKGGPDLSWMNEAGQESDLHKKRIPPPLFPARNLPTPKSLSSEEKSQITSLINIRDRIRRGPLYTILEPSILLDSKGKINPRAGFDPFNDQERYSKRYHRKRRTIPDLTERSGYTLKLFPVELWPVLDPTKRQTEYWDTLSEEVKARISGKRGVKRKREKIQFRDDLEDDDNEGDGEGKGNRSADDAGDSEESDTILDADARRRRTAKKTRRGDGVSQREKKGLDAEDDYPEVDQNDADADGEGGVGGGGRGAGGGGDAEDEPQDSEFGSDDEDDDNDDYNAENYFDGGDDDDYGDDGGDDDGGGDVY